jgi:cyclopropane-fatty-acyl-phospholipid synthase
VICRKLLLQPGDRVLEVGAGWGFMPIYMVKNYGVTSTVYNPVRRQNEYMRERFARHGVADRIRIVEGDHRDIVNEPKGSYDKFLTIGVHEHHGLKLKRYDEWWGSIAHSLRPGGIGFISTSSLMQRVATSLLALKYIFPGGHLPSLPHELLVMNKHEITLIEVENLWPHYQRTLREWRERFHLRWSEIQKADPAVFTERFRRRWSMYLESTMEVFSQSLDLSHIVFVRGRSSEYHPLARAGQPAADFRTGDQDVECYR